VAISFHSEGIKFDLKNKNLHKAWIKNLLEIHHRKPGKLAFVFISNEQIKLMNREYLQHNRFTDVITFDYTDKDIVAGDIFISFDQVKSNAQYYNVRFEEELRRVMIHGVLHLIGYGDATEKEKEKMRRKENEALHLWLKEV
jgi:rRNA maturation RNase YbeY